MFSFCAHILCFALAVLISTQKASGLLCYCGEKDVLGNGCSIINGQLTMICREGQDVCMNMEVLGGNYTLDGIFGYVYQGCWNSPKFVPKVYCKDRAILIKSEKIVKSDYPSLMCYCDYDMCNGNQKLSVVENNGEKLISSALTILLVFIFNYCKVI